MRVVAAEGGVLYYENDPHDSVSAGYYLDTYGSCSTEKCECLERIRLGRGSWLGRGCASWRPHGFTDFAGHLEWFTRTSAPT